MRQEFDYMEVMEVLIHIGFSESKHIGEERKLIYVLAGAYKQEHATALYLCFHRPIYF